MMCASPSQIRTAESPRYAWRSRAKTARCATGWERFESSPPGPHGEAIQTGRTAQPSSRAVPHNGYDPPASPVVEELYAVDARLKRLPCLRTARFVPAECVDEV